MGSALDLKWVKSQSESEHPLQGIDRMIDALLKINNFDILHNLLRSIDGMIDRIVEECSKL